MKRKVLAAAQSRLTQQRASGEAAKGQSTSVRGFFFFFFSLRAASAVPHTQFPLLPSRRAGPVGGAAGFDCLDLLYAQARFFFWPAILRPGVILIRDIDVDTAASAFRQRALLIVFEVAFNAARC